MDNLIYMNEPFIVSHLKCGICKKPYIDPVSLPSPCEQTYCRQCIQPNLQNHSTNCPECNNKTLAIEDLIPERSIGLRILNNLPVKCSLCSEENIKRADFLKHINELCPKRIVNCQANDIKCAWNGSYDELDNHWNSCIYEKLRPLLTELLKDRQQLNQLKNDFQNLENKSKQQENQIEQVEKEKKNLEEKIKQMELNIEKENQQFKEQKLKDIENLTEQIKQIENQNKHLQEQLDEIPKLKDENQTLIEQIKQIEQLENQNKLLQQQYDEQLNDNIKFNDKNQTLIEQIEELQNQNKLLQEQLDENQTLREQINEDDLEVLNEQLNPLCDENQILNEEICRLKSFEIQHADLTNQIHVLYNENQSLKKQYDAFKSQVTPLYETFQKSVSQMNNFQFFNRTLQEQLLQINSFDQENQQLKTQLDHLKSIQTDYQTLNQNYQLQLRQNHDLMKENQFLKQKLHENIIEIEQLNINNKRLETKLEPPVIQSTKSIDDDHQNDKLEDMIDQSLKNAIINLNSQKLHDNDIEYLINKYLTQTKYQSLILWNNSLTSNSLIRLFSSLNLNKTLTVLSISNNPLSNQAIQYLSQSLSFNNTTLKQLILASNQITDQGLNYLSDMLKSNQTLITIGLQDNQITDKSMKYFSEVIQFYNQTIEEISLYSNKFITDLSIDFINNMIKTNQSLKTFWIWDCQLSEQSKFILQQSIQNKTDFDLRL